MTTTYAKAPYCVQKPSVLRCAPRDQIGQRKYFSEITAVAASRRASPPLPSSHWTSRTRAAHVAAGGFCARTVGGLLVARRRRPLLALRSRRRQRRMVPYRGRRIARARPRAEGHSTARATHARCASRRRDQSDVACARVGQQRSHSRRHTTAAGACGARGCPLVAARRGASGRMRQQVELRRSPRDDTSRRFVQPIERGVNARVARGGFAGKRERNKDALANVGRLAVQAEEQQLGGGVGQLVQSEIE